jgi:hypothetical protein
MEAEIVVATVEPRKWVALPVERWELLLVGGGHEIVPNVVFIGLGVVAARRPWHPRIYNGVFDMRQGELACDLLVSLLGDCGDQVGHLVTEWLLGANNGFDGGKAEDHALEGDLWLIALVFS